METMNGLLEYGVASRVHAEESVSGDRFLVHSFSNGVLASVVDGLGHGRDAAEAAEIAIRTLELHASKPIPTLIEVCHRSLRNTRGVTMSVVRFDAIGARISWLGVGNVQATLIRAKPDGALLRHSLIPHPGVVGVRYSTLRERSLPVEAGDVLLLATDGIGGGFASSLDLSGSPERIAEETLHSFARGGDDALVLVARCIGTSR